MARQRNLLNNIPDLETDETISYDSRVPRILTDDALWSIPSIPVFL